MAYSDQQKATACQLVRANNGTIDDVLVEAIRLALDEPKLPRMTIWRWWKHYQTVTNVTDVTQKKERVVTDRRPLAEKLEDAAHKFIDHAVRDELLIWSSSKDAMLAASIAIDKMRLLLGLPTEIVAVIPDLIAELEKGGASASDVFLKLLERARAANAQRGADHAER